MSQLSRGIFGAVAVSLTFGAALAAGRDLAEIQNPAGNSQVVNTSEAINRAAKADRADGAVGSAASTRTISLRQDVLTDTSVLIRVLIRLPVTQEARNNVPAPAVVKPQAKKGTVACEPPVSVLTEVAKRLEPGRCIT
ncbi:MAG TPA: hypothetical protein VK621_12575 [Bradyrhizobium sp.]|nr:hypothetical protein [Bradyrhizobium sp.]